ncbi:MAG: carboxypeptidase M32 [Candidatus Heimdallarchaeota archaeon]|nr:carboxypeptidase M32 [Candidatus Heimdallarchaeota archaeon]
MNDEYKELMGLYEDISVLGSTRSVLSYDLETKIMAPAGIEHRGRQLGLLGKLNHQMMNAPRYQELIRKLYGNESLDEIQARNIEILYRSMITATSVPTELVMRLAKQANTTNETWKKAKMARDFSLVKKDVKDLFDVTIERAQILADVKGFKDPYSALLAERDPGFTKDNLTSIFAETKSYLIPMIKKIKEKQGDINTSFLASEYPRELQVKISELIADFFGYDYSSESARGRIGEVEHPLTIGCGPDDVRITVKYENYASVIGSTNHELGHALHGLFRKKDWRYTPINDSGAPSIGETTSRYTENKIGKDMAYWDHFYPILQKLTGLKQSKEDFYQAFTFVNPSTKRMSADEVSYGLHIIIRFEIEKMLFEGNLEFADIPQVWNDKYLEYMGVEVPDDTAGPLQDLHWYSYYIGYFQGYALGDLLNSQIHYTMENALPDWREDISAGNMNSIHQWMVENVYSLGFRYDPIDFVEHITDKKFETKYHKQYLEEKYLR